jgi:hypothetical protein
MPPSRPLARHLPPRTLQSLSTYPYPTLPQTFQLVPPTPPHPPRLLLGLILKYTAYLTHNKAAAQKNIESGNTMKSTIPMSATSSPKNPILLLEFSPKIKTVATCVIKDTNSKKSVRTLSSFKLTFEQS